MIFIKEKWEHREAGMDYNQANSKKVPDTQNAADFTKPVAYDADGKPLYAAPVEQPVQPQFVHMTRAIEPVELEVSPEIKKKHDESMKRFPGLNLSEHEYVISAVRRHPIGLIGPLLATALSVSLVFVFVFNYPYVSEVTGLPLSSFGTVVFIGILTTILFLIGGYLAIWVYVNNCFYLTNESVIQEIQISIFSRREQTVSLMNIEDASFSQRGPLQTFVNYGSIRLSTEGEETTYRFDYAENPREQIAILNNAVEAFKNGRPVDG